MQNNSLAGKALLQSGVKFYSGILLIFICYFSTFPCYALDTSHKSRAKSTHSVNKNDLDDQLIDAVMKNNIDKVRKLIDQGANVNAQLYNMTPLTAAAHTNNLEIIKILIAAGADVGVEDGLGNTALTLATLSGNDAIKNVLLKAGANAHFNTSIRSNSNNNNSINNQSKDYLNKQLFKAIENDDQITFLKLINAGADVNSRNELGFTPLHWAYIGKHDEIADLLVHHDGTDVNAKDNKFGSPPLMTAIVASENKGGLKQAVKDLIARGANVNAKAKDGRTALMLAVKDFDTLQTLIISGANVNAKDNDGISVLMYAVLQGEENVVKTLIAAGADVNAKAKNGDSVLMKAARSEFLSLSIAHGLFDEDKTQRNDKIKSAISIFKALFDNGANINAQNNEGMTALMITAADIMLSFNAMPLLASGAAKNINIKNKKGQTALQIAISSQNFGFIRVLSFYKENTNNTVDLNIYAANGWTALTMAAFFNQKATVQNLLDAGADVNVPNKKGQKALDLTTDDEIREMIRAKIKK